MKLTMNWNADPEGATLPPQYAKNQSSFLQQSLINQLTTTSHSSFSYPGSNREACMYPNNLNPVPQPLMNLLNYKTPQQISVSDMRNGTVVASQTSVERITYANVQGPKPQNHNLQMSSGVTQNMWLNSPVKNSMVSHTGANLPHQIDFGTSTPNMHALQGQFVTSDTYSMQLQMIPSNPVKIPVSYPGNQGLNQPLSEQQVGWTQQYSSNGPTYPDYRPFPKQYCYSSQNFLQDATVQKQNLTSPTSLQVKNSRPPGSSQTLLSKQTAMLSHQYASQTDKRPPPPYNCRYRSQPLQSTPHGTNHFPVGVPHTQEVHSSEIRKDFCTGFQQLWQNPSENVRTVGYYNSKGNTNDTQPFNEPVRPSVDGVPPPAQNNQEKTNPCKPAPNQVMDTNVTKEKLVRDIKTLVEIKKKFSELARKIKINKDLLMAAGCSKITNASSNEPAPSSELSLKQTAPIQPGSQLTPVTPEIAKGQPPTVMGSAEETNKTHSVLTSVQEINCRKVNQINSSFLNSVCSEKLPVPDQLHDSKVMTSLKTSAVESTRGPLSNSQPSSESSVKAEQNLPAIRETISVPQSESFKEYISKYPNKNPLLLGFLLQKDETEAELLKEGSQTIPDSKPNSCEVSLSTQVTGNQLDLKTLETSSISNVSPKVSESSFCLDPKSSTEEASAQSDNHCSMELLATCLSLWKKEPSETTGDKQYNESKTNRTAEVCVKSPYSVVGNSQNKTVNPLPETALSMVVQNYESPCASTSKGTELQIAIVSPLILSDVKTLSVKGVTPEAVPKTVYPVIKEGSVCSLQNQLAENTRETPVFKVDVNGPVVNTILPKVFPLIQKEKQNELTSGSSESTPIPNQGKHHELAPDSRSPTSDQQTLCQSRDGTIVADDLLQIDNICSLVKGDTSYNSQIAEIFSPSKKVEPQKPSLPNHQAISSRQGKEQLDNNTENKNLGFQIDKFVWCTDVSHKITDQSKSLHPPETSLKCLEAGKGITEGSNLECTPKKESTANDMCCESVAIEQDTYLQEVDASSSCNVHKPADNEIHNDKTSVLYLHDQLSELLKEFPYGIEAVNTQKGPVGQQVTDQISGGRTGDKTDSDSKDSTDQIKITILSSEQMKELFPEQDEQPCDVDILAKPQKEEEIIDAGNQHDPQAPTESCDSVSLDPERDDIRCCALGWLSMVYEGVPQCQCNSTKDSTVKEGKGKDQCSLETDICKQGRKTLAGDVQTVECHSLSSNPDTPLTLPDRKSLFPKIKTSDIKDRSKSKDNSSLRTEQELTKQDKKTDPLKSQKRKGKLKFHEVTFHSSNKRTSFSEQASQESLRKKHILQNLRPLKPKAGFLTNKDYSLKKNGSLIQSGSPEKMKFKAGEYKQKHLEKRKLDNGNIVDMEIKRKKYDKQEQNKNVEHTLKACNSLSNPNEKASIKEKAVSETKFSDLKDRLSRFRRVLTPREYLQRQKNKEAVDSNASKKICVKNVPSDSEFRKSGKVSVHAGDYGKSNERFSGSVHTSRESLNIKSYGKNLKMHHSEESKTCDISKNIKGTVERKQPDKMLIDKNKLDKKLANVNNEAEFSQMSTQAKNQKKLYLNRVGFKCTARESICLTKIENSPRKPIKEKRQDNKPKACFPMKDCTEKSMLEFKLCPDLLFKNTNSHEEQKDLKPYPRKEQAPVQDNNVNARLSKRSFSAEGFEMLQNPVKDSKAMFQTYKQMYLDKRSRSLGSSPVK
ncbi:uncharacterized protein KIAA1551 homolog isoform X2 [Tupaia chinensis]|uniref:uncharacterized protein KIAA1551 homolog isoform X2 n=1 Tax=Tupaia chinensis TaxID=246437 RepID=UPI0003C91F89|nr:uncharacterized protein KIAA1551 homolog isoform X2 [Tupaia chinensis]